MRAWLIALSGMFLLTACKQERLPFFGERRAKTITINGIPQTDTLYHQVPEFQFINQNNDYIGSDQVYGRIYVANYFFCSCPSICPRMMKQLSRVDSTYKGNPDIWILSHTVDPENDTVARLKRYEEKNGYNQSGRWHLLTGNKQVLYDQAYKGYFSSAGEDAAAPGGFLHSEQVFLIDRFGHIRGIYGGTEPNEISRLIKEIGILLEEE